MDDNKLVNICTDPKSLSGTLIGEEDERENLYLFRNEIHHPLRGGEKIGRSAPRPTIYSTASARPSRAKILSTKGQKYL